MMGPRLPTRSGDEHDAVTRWRHVLHWSPGERARIKRRMRRRERRAADTTARAEPDPVFGERWEHEDFMGEYPWDEDNAA